LCAKDAVRGINEKYGDCTLKYAIDGFKILFVYFPIQFLCIMLHHEIVKGNDCRENYTAT
jgi:hypothetical protein